jgi:hypothetical protein
MSLRQYVIEVLTRHCALPTMEETSTVAPAHVDAE